MRKESTTSEIQFQSEELCALALSRLTGKERHQATQKALEFTLNSSLCLEELCKVCPCLKLSCREEAEFVEVLQRTKALRVETVSIFNDDYPEALLNIYNPPPIIFLRGNKEVLSDCKHFIAIVGSRNADREGIELAREIALNLAKAGVVVVSGLALGVDGAAHRGAIDSGSLQSTIAVLGNGLPNIYPHSHARLANEIINCHGAILSQFEIGTPAYPSNFLDRNRIISGLSQAVCVIEAGQRSGSLVTARYALEQGREVLAIPGSVKNSRFKGSNALVKDGAHLVTNASDILEILSIPDPYRILLKKTKLANISHPILKLLKEYGEISLEELKSKLPTVESFSAELLELELASAIIIKPGNLVTLS